MRLSSAVAGPMPRVAGSGPARGDRMSQLLASKAWLLSAATRGPVLQSGAAPTLFAGDPPIAKE